MWRICLEVIDDLRFPILPYCNPKKVAWIVRATHSSIFDFFDIIFTADLIKAVSFHSMIEVMACVRAFPFLVQASGVQRKPPKVLTALLQASEETGLFTYTSTESTEQICANAKATSLKLLAEGAAPLEKGTFVTPLQTLLLRSETIKAFQIILPFLAHDIRAFGRTSRVSDVGHLFGLFATGMAVPLKLWKLVTLIVRLVYRRELGAEAYGIYQQYTVASAQHKTNPTYLSIQAEGGFLVLQREILAKKRCCILCSLFPQDGKYCSRCKEARYCNAECQKADWASHKEYCGKKSLKELAEEVRSRELPPHLAPPSADEIIAYIKKELREYIDPTWRPYKEDEPL